MSNTFRTTLTCGLLAFASLARAQAPQSSRRDVTAVYASLCANCHGPKLEGALGPSLVDDTWKSGADDESIARSIREGQPPAGMPAFSGALSPQDIRALVIYIREQGAERRSKGTPIAKPTADQAVRSELHAFKLETVAEGRLRQGPGREALRGRRVFV
jgi:mono/diheme cytochrome c family protein